MYMMVKHIHNMYMIFSQFKHVNSCTCLGNIYMLLTFSFPIALPSFYPSMYMFVRNSKKKFSMYW